jgi:hypothetical protein
MKSKHTLRSIAGAVVLQLGLLTGSAQTYVYTYTGNDFTSVANAPSAPPYGIRLIGICDLRLKAQKF